MTLIAAIDPGEVWCGLAVLDLSRTPRPRIPGVVDQSSKGKMRLLRAETLPPGRLYRELETLAPRLAAVVLERYALYPWLLKEQGFSEVETAQCVGVVCYICSKIDLPVYKQDAKGNLKDGRTIAKKAGFKMKDRALGSGQFRYRGPDFDLPGRPHRRDACSHGVKWSATHPDSPLLVSRQ